MHVSNSRITFVIYRLSNYAHSDSIQTHDSLERLVGTCSAIGIGLDVVLATTCKYVRSDRVCGITGVFYELRDT